MLTFVHANSDEGGLEVRARDGSWLAPKASGDAYVVNVGDGADKGFEVEATGRIDYWNFYARRAKRLLPAGARCLGDDGVLYDPQINYDRVKGKWNDWSRDPDSIVQSTRTVDIPAPDAEIRVNYDSAPVSGTE